MPKIIAPKRTSKSVTVEDYWAIRQKFSKQKEKTNFAYKEKEVEKRHRFLRLGDQIKVFNPLDYFITKDQDFSTEHKTHTHAYLQTINYRLPEEIMTVKKHMFGLASILKNIGRIYGMLWDHLGSQDAWKLVQCMLKDTRDEGYELWLESGLQKMVDSIGTQFKQPKFKQIFNTLCIFMEVCFPKITADEISLYNFLGKMVEYYFKSVNKYIRKFSTRAISYLISNLEQELFQRLLNHIIIIEAESQNVLPFVSDILAQRLKYSDGCLTPNSLQELISMVGWVRNLNLQDGIMIKFVQKVLSNLQEKRSSQQNLTLFDFGYIVKAFIHLASQKKIKAEFAVEGIIQYLEEIIHERHEKRRKLNEESLKQVSQFLWQNLPSLPQNKQIYHLLALSFSLPLQNVSNIIDYLSLASGEQLVLQFLQLIDQNLSKDTSMLILAGFKEHIYNFLNNIAGSLSEGKIFNVYKLFLIAKRHQIVFNCQKMFQKKINIKKSIDELTKVWKSNEIQGPNLYEYSLVFLRLLTIIQLPKQVTSNLSTLMAQTLNNYYKIIKIFLLKKKKSSKSIFCCSSYTEQIFLYSHSSIPVVWQGFNLVESFIQIEKNLHQAFIDRKSPDFQIWHKIVINRPSICRQITEVLQTSSHNYLIVLQSRHRNIRHLAIQYLRKSRIFEQHDELLAMIENIEEEDVDLDTERNVKRMLLDMLRYGQQKQLQDKLNNVLLSWCLGFAFTGFKLIEESFANFLAGLLENQQQIDTSGVIRFLEYYSFRNSRVYKSQIQQFFSNAQKQNKELALSQKFIELANFDFENSELDTVQFIGVQRITLAISKSEKVKKKLGDQLLNIINQYFSQEFFRFQKTLIKNEGQYLNEKGEINEHMQPPKTTFLKHILKIVPADYLPPFECLHYTSDFLKLQSISKIKRQQWQLLWNKNTKMDHTRIRFEAMSSRQMQLYIHFLWGELLRADANRLRIIIEHVRDYMNHKVDYLMEIFFNQLTLKVTDQREIKRIFEAMDSRKLLTFVYILKAIVKALKNYVRNNYKRILSLLVSVIEILEDSNGKQEKENQIEEENCEKQLQNQREVQQIEENEQSIVLSKKKKYKNHRKQVYKILNSLVSMLADDIVPQEMTKILQIFHSQNKIKTLGKVSLHSTPGLLLFFRQLSKFNKFHSLFSQFSVFQQIQQIFTNGYSLQSSSSVNVCAQILNGLLNIGQNQGQMQEENFSSAITSQTAEKLLSSILIWITSLNKVRNDLEFQLLHIVLLLMSKCNDISSQWQRYLLLNMSRIVSMKTMSEGNKNKLLLFIKISMEYVQKAKGSDFLLQLLTLVPQIKQISHRKLIVDSISKDIAKGNQKSIGPEAVQVVAGLNSTIDGGLVIEVDYGAFFDAVAKYKQHCSLFTANEQEFVIYNVLAYLSSPELSVRKAVNTVLELFLGTIKVEGRALVAKLFRIVGQELKKPYCSEDLIFWSVFACVGHFVKWVINNDLIHSGTYEKFSSFVGQNNNIFEMLCSIGQNKKLQGLKDFKTILNQNNQIMANQAGDRYPNALTTVILPVLEHFILPHTENYKDRYEIAGNLTSSLAHVSLQVFQLAMKKGGESLQKKQLKRMISKLKFDDAHLKKNILLIKVIGQIVESIDLPKVTQIIHRIVSQEGFEDFHKKIVQKQSRKTNMKQAEDDSQSQEQMRKRIAFDGINNEVDDDELINMGYLTLDKKLLQAQEANRQPEDQEPSIIKFLRINVLLPLKTMLMFQNRSQKNAKEETDKSRMFLSIVVTKIILKFPTDVFINELQKILSKLGKLLKKKQIEVRQNSRKCLAQIAKLVGPDMFYLIFRELKFHLRDNFQHHILNYSIYYILQKYGTLQSGSIDHCLPIILPSIIDQIYGKSGAEKEMVDENLIPTLNMESKKRKSNDLLAIICKQISMSKIDYLVKYFEKFLLEYMNTEANVTKYEQMLTNIIGGLSKNEDIMKIDNSDQFIEVVYSSIQKLKGQIKLYKFDDQGVKHESTVKQDLGVGKKAGKQVLQIQQQAGRNQSIFKKQAKQIQQRRNHEILVGCFMQFHLAVLALLIKKKIINSEQHSHKFESILTFIVECIEHRDNRLVHKCLKVIHNVIHWKKMPNIAQIRKKTSRKIFALIEKLTSADQDLLRECFTLLNDLFEQVNITYEVLHILITIIKLHITSVEKTIAQQPYKLLKTVMIKISADPALIFDPLVYELYEYIRATLVSTNLDHIRSTCRQICCLYIRQNRQNVPQVKKKSKSVPQIDFGKELSFYLNNLDCKYSETQQAILDVIRSYVAWHSKEEIEETGEVIVMALGTAYSNDADNEVKISQLIKFVVEKIDNSKVLGLMDKCIVWASNEGNVLISTCGFFILQNSLIVKGNLLNKQRKETISKICTKVLQNQQEKVEIYIYDLKERIRQNQTLKNNPEWQQIIEKEDANLKIEKSLKFAIAILSLFLEQSNSIEKEQTILLWKLVSAPSEFIHCQTATVLMKVASISQAIGQNIISLEQSEENSLKSKVLSMVRDTKQAQPLKMACQLVQKVLEQIKHYQECQQVFESLVLGMLHRISKSILNLKKNQRSMSMAFDMLQTIMRIDSQICAKIMANQKVFGQIFWTIAKVNRNEMIMSQIKEKNDQYSEIIKNTIGQAEFYRQLATVEADRKMKKNTEKAEMLKLAITDQVAYGQAKAKKKHKKQ